jgi:pyridinium-3,5-bisthiocarboxylic acid mononucleotide nickel chelatase
VKALYFDVFAGISGDMTLGALVDLGLPLELLREAVDALRLEQVEIVSQATERRGIRGIKVDVRCSERGVVRTWSNIRSMIEKSRLDHTVKQRSLDIFHILAEAEAKIHSRNVDQVHFHEIGAVDSIVDIVGCSVGLHYLGVERIYSSPIPTGKGWVRTEHGVYPVPPPAVAEILTDVPCYSGDITTEIVTPTGAAIIKACVDEFGPMPLMRVERAGYGAGTRELDVPNLLRVFSGELERERGLTRERAVMVLTNIDDMNPEFYDHVMELLFEAGAVDVWLTPIQMKKTRPAVSLQVLAPPPAVERVKEILFRETNTLGLRLIEVEKESVQRDFLAVETEWGTVRVKLGIWGGEVVNLAPEYADCREAARRAGVPLKLVFDAAVAAARAGGGQKVT